MILLKLKQKLLGCPSWNGQNPQHGKQQTLKRCEGTEFSLIVGETEKW